MFVCSHLNMSALLYVMGLNLLKSESSHNFIRSCKTQNLQLVENKNIKYIIKLIFWQKNTKLIF